MDDGTLRGLQTQYVVTQPEQQSPHKPKEHYIFGGTQIVELGTTMGSDQIAREKNQSTWNGKFVLESAPPQRTVTKSWTKQSTSTDPSTATVTTTTTTEEVVKGGAGGPTVKTNVSTESSKLVSDTMKKQSDTSKVASGKLIDSRIGGTDVTDNANANDLLLESERCIAKKAYVTTNKDDDKVPSSSTADIESQILSNKSLFDTATTTKTTTSDAKTSDTKFSTETIDSKYDHRKPGSDRYPISTVPSRSTNVQDTNITSSSLVNANDASNRYSTEQFSQSFSTSSRTERASSSNKVVEIVDGKERIVSDTYNESGSQQLKSSQEKYKAKYGTGITPEVEYDQNVAEENIKFATDKRDKEPIFDRDYRDSYRHIKQTGDNAPIEHVLGSYETTRFDDKTKKYVTDVRHHENNRLLDNTSRTTDSIQSKYDVETTRLNYDNLTNKNQLTQSTFDSNQTKSLRDSNVTSTFDQSTSFDSNTRNVYDGTVRFDTNVKFDSNVDDRASSKTSFIDNVSSSTSKTNDFIRTAKSDSIDSKSTTYTTKVFDNKTNTWKVVDESSTNEMNQHSTTHKQPSDIDQPRRSPTKYIDSTTHTTETNKFIDKNNVANSSSNTTTTNIDSVNTSKTTDRSKTLSDKRTSIDKLVSRTSDTKSMTKTTDEKVSQHLYDEKTKTWREVDEKTIKSKRPSLIRYVSKDDKGKFTTIYKRKLFDKRSGTWKVVDEKVYRNNNFNEHIPEVIEDVTNVTTTTYTTKVFDTKTNTWRIVDEQTFTDRNTTVPKDIADEIARDQPDIANITTTTELTKVSDKRYQFAWFYHCFFDFSLREFFFKKHISMHFEWTRSK